MCIEEKIENIHNLTNLVDLFTPQNSSTLNLTSPMGLYLNLIAPNPNTFRIEWTLNGMVIKTDIHLINISANDLILGNNLLSTIIEDATSLLRVDNHETTHFSNITWSIHPITSNVHELSSNENGIKLFPNPTQDI